MPAETNFKFNPHSQLLKKNHLTTFHAPLFVYLTTQNDQFHKTTYFYHSITVHIYVLPEVDMLLYLYLIWKLPIPFVPNRFPFRLFMYRDSVQIRLGAIGNEEPHCAHVLTLTCTRTGLLYKYIYLCDTIMYNFI